MQFERMTKEDIQNLSGFLLAPGPCSFVIKKAEEVLGKTSGKPQMQIDMDVTDINGKTTSVRDFIFYSEAAKWKLVSFCKGIGIEDKLMEGSIETRDVINRKGQLIIQHEEYNGEKKNRVNRYLPYLDKAMEQAKKAEEAPFHDDDLPF